jgi:hypothetical protein
LGLKGAKRSAMHALSPDRKKFLLRQNREFKSSIQHPTSNEIRSTYSASYGPSSAAAMLPKLLPQLTGDAGLIRRLSIVGWGSTNAPAPSVTSSDSTDANGRFSNLSPSTSSKVVKSSEDAPQPLQPQNTGSMWNNWWTSSERPSSSDKNFRQEFAKSAQWYIDGLRIRKAPDMKLVKHLIALRVHLSTANLTFVQDFVGAEKGLSALGALLANLVGKGGRRQHLTEVETTVLLQTLKCLRVLLNTSVGCSVYAS